MSRNKFLSYLVVLCVSTLVNTVGGIQPALAATGSICAQFGATTQGNYVVMNNRWGGDATQCIDVTKKGFSITRQDGVGNLNGAPVSYPAIYTGCHYTRCSPNTKLPMKISSIKTVPTKVTLSYPKSGIYNAAYDIWINSDTNVSGVQDTEIMIWLNRTGTIQPIGSKKATVTLAGYSWEVWVGSNGQNNVVSYLATGIKSFTADLKPFISDALTRGNGFGTESWYLTSIQMGFEPWVGGVGLAVKNFSTTVK